MSTFVHTKLFPCRWVSDKHPLGEVGGGSSGLNKRKGRRRRGKEGGPASGGLSEVLLEEVQHGNLVMLSGLWTSDAVSLIWVNL